MNKQDLLKAIHECRDEIESCWAGATDEQLTARPGPQPDWSVKDLIAHLTFWEQDMLTSLGNSALATTPDWNDSTDAVNARVFQANQDRSLDEIRTAFRRSLDQICDLVGSLSDADLDSTEMLPTPDRMPLWQYIADETYEHYHDDHLPDVRAWARREGLLL
ncbi:MAG: ClbS/DfsB family four-helix bundle protein [Chloroflexota bacterium]